MIDINSISPSDIQERRSESVRELRNTCGLQGKCEGYEEWRDSYIKKHQEYLAHDIFTISSIAIVAFIILCGPLFMLLQKRYARLASKIIYAEFIIFIVLLPVAGGGIATLMYGISECFKTTCSAEVEATQQLFLIGGGLISAFLLVLALYNRERGKDMILKFGRTAIISLILVTTLVISLLSFMYVEGAVRSYVWSTSAAQMLSID